MLSDRKYAAEDLGHVLVLGLGVSGKAASEYLASLLGGRLRSLTILGGGASEANEAWAGSFIAKNPDKPIKVVFDREDAASWIPADAEKFDVCVASPGISMFSDFYQSAAAASREVISEIELAWRESRADSTWVAITGSNGKTTTTALTEHILKVGGIDACAVGNIGDACIAQVASDVDVPGKCYVVETSSYQLASVRNFAPNVAVILGITPDHLKWHGSFEHYAESKFKLLDNMASYPGSVAVLDAVNDVVRAKVRELKAQGSERGFEYIPVGTAKGVSHDMRDACGSKSAAFLDMGAGAFSDGSLGTGQLTIAFDGREHALCQMGELQIVGVHNAVNALAAASAAIALDLPDSKVIEGLKTFAPLEHRIEPCGSVRGVSFYNDSKATNVDATVQALKAFLPKKPIVMFGGDDKGTSLAELVDASRDNAKAIVCFGEGGPRFYEALSHLKEEGMEVVLIDTFDNAFKAACEFAGEGDIVLLSPACASFDEFTCFEERGEHFKALVSQLS